MNVLQIHVKTAPFVPMQLMVTPAPVLLGMPAPTVKPVGNNYYLNMNLKLKITIPIQAITKITMLNISNLATTITFRYHFLTK